MLIACHVTLHWPSLETVFQILSIIAGFGAAVLWLWSAKPPETTTFPIAVVRSDSPMGEPLGGSPFGATYVGHGHSSQLDQLGQSLVNQARWSSFAAWATAASVLLQALAVLFHLVCS
jgi:hypothetical protein